MACRPECVLSSECPRNLACIQQKCTDPCPGTCGTNAICDVVNHIAMCHCPDRMTGNAFVQCTPVQRRLTPFFFKNTSSFLTHCLVDVYRNPCNPSPCGSYAECREQNGQAVCSCLPNYFGVPPSCRPECSTNYDCSPSLACQNQRCVDPCPGACGAYAECRTVNHSPFCSCRPGYTGNPIVQCHMISKLK